MTKWDVCRATGRKAIGHEHGGVGVSSGLSHPSTRAPQDSIAHHARLPTPFETRSHNAMSSTTRADAAPLHAVSDDAVKLMEATRMIAATRHVVSI